MLIWLCPDDITKGYYYYPLYIANSGVTNQAWGVLLNYGDDGEVSFITNISASGRAVSTKCIAAGEWHQVVCVVAGTTDRRCFVDGGNKGTNSIYASVPAGLNRISIGRAGDSTPGYYFPGRVGCVFTWNRALTDDEIAWLYREPYVMFDAGHSAKSLSFPIAIVPVSGTINVKTKLSGKLGTTDKTRRLEKSWMLDVLTNGMTGNAFNLSTALSMGWFWMRSSGCSVLYKGRNIDEIDFSHTLKVSQADALTISPPGFCVHDKDVTYYYVVRRFNKAGQIEKTIDAAVKLSLDSNGDIEENQPNSVLTISAEVIENDKAQLSWIYCPLSQKAKPVCFRIYFDNGSGQIDYENPISEIAYVGQKLYRFKSSSLDIGSYLFAIRVADSCKVEDNSTKQIKVQIANTNPLSIRVFDAESI